MKIISAILLAISCLALCGAAGAGIPSTAIASKIDPIRRNSAWTPTEQYKIHSNLRRQVKRTQSSGADEEKLLKLEREVGSLQRQQTSHLREISRLKKQIRLLKAGN